MNKQDFKTFMDWYKIIQLKQKHARLALQSLPKEIEDYIIELAFSKNWRCLEHNEHVKT